MTQSTPPHDYGASYPQYSATPSSAPSSMAAPSNPYPGQAGAPLPPSNAGWAVAAVLFFWPLSFAAFNHLHNIYPSWAMGDYQAAQLASDRVKSLGKIALCIAIVLFVLFVVGYGFVIAAILSSASRGYGS